MHRKNSSQLICCTRLLLTACKALDNVFHHRIHAHRCQFPSHLCHVLFLIRDFMHKAATRTPCLRKGVKGAEQVHTHQGAEEVHTLL